jgi:hypothetical protein
MSKSSFAAFFSKKAVLIPMVIKNDRWDKPYFRRAAAPPSPRGLRLARGRPTSPARNTKRQKR